MLFAEKVVCPVVHGDVVVLFPCVEVTVDEFDDGDVVSLLVKEGVAVVLV